MAWRTGDRQPSALTWHREWMGHTMNAMKKHDLWTAGARRGLAALAAALLAASSLAAEEWRHGERQNIWPDGRIPDFQEHQIAEMTDVSRSPGFRPEYHRMPYLEWFDKPKTPNGACMILISGGSYMNCCDVGLIKTWRDRFTELGYQTVNLVYRTPRAKGLPCYQSAWEDGQRAVRLVRSQAMARGFDPEKIGVIGMSGGILPQCLPRVRSRRRTRR